MTNVFVWNDIFFTHDVTLKQHVYERIFNEDKHHKEQVTEFVCIKENSKKKNWESG